MSSLTVFALLLLGAYASDPIVMAPSASKTGPQKLLIIINGAYVPNTDYQQVGAAIQRASPLKLWVAIPSFILNCPNPGEIDSKIKASVSAVQAAGFANISAPADAFVAGHSLGGIFSQGVVKKGGYAGLILLGSYLSTVYSNSVESFPYPVLTLAGELDGLTRITRIVREWNSLQTLIGKKGKAAADTHPVVALPGQSHSQFCSNVNVTSFGHKDLAPAVSLSAAHEAIGEAVADFFSNVLGSDEAAKSRMAVRADYTQQLLSPYMKAQMSDASSWCVEAQRALAPNVTGGYIVQPNVCSNFGSFDLTYPSVYAGPKVVEAVDLTVRSLNPTDSSLTPVSPTNIDTKTVTQAALIKAFGQHGSAAPDSCALANVAAVAAARELLKGSATLSRYDAEGKPFVIEEDDVFSTGVTWQTGSLGLSTDGKHVKVKSARLVTGSNMLCKLLVPSKVVEYMMVDGLPRFDGSVP